MEQQYLPETYSLRQLEAMADHIIETWENRTESHGFTHVELELFQFVKECKRKFLRMRGEEVPAR